MYRTNVILLGQQQADKKVDLGGTAAGIANAKTYLAKANSILRSYLYRHGRKAEPDAIISLRNWIKILEPLADPKRIVTTQVFQSEVEKIEKRAQAEANKPRITMMPTLRQQWGFGPSYLSPSQISPWGNRYGFGLQGSSEQSATLGDAKAELGALSEATTTGLVVAGVAVIAAFLIFG